MSRQYTCKVMYSILCLCTLIQLSDNSVANKRREHQPLSAVTNPKENEYQKYSDKIGLYSMNDDVEILSVDNFKNEIYGNRRAWLIEFYNAWCGFCQRFAPSWKDFATDVKDWKGLVGIGAIDCSNDKNTGICRDFEIMGYPTLRYFNENYEEGQKNLGKVVSSKGGAHEHRHTLLEMIVSEQLDGRGKMYPTLLPYNSSDLSDLFKLETDSAFLIVQETTDHIGQEVSMDLNKIQNIVVRYTFNNNTEIVNKLAIKKFPVLVVIERDKPFQILNVENNREAYRSAIQTYLGPKKKTYNNEDYSSNGEDNNVPDITDFLEEREKIALKEKIKKMGDIVFQMDLETALRYSLKHEVASVVEITKEKLEALKNYVNVLANYFPFGRNGRLFLQELKEFVWFKASVRGEDIGNILQNAEKENQYVFSSPQRWLACKGSITVYRGYPCGLWKLFHYLTVNAADYNERVRGPNPKVVLEAMHGYIKNFFGCSDCSQHFQGMAKRRGIMNVTSWNDSILWLWSAHNEVNKRLSGDQTEDPEFPKYQFPSKDRCPRCYTENNSWNISEVLHYLKHVYTSINVRYIGSDTRILHLGLDGSSNVQSDVGFFKSIDAALCLILYLASFMLILVLIYMFLKRGYRKKVYQHDLSGKV